MGQKQLGVDFGHTGIKITEASTEKGVVQIHHQGFVRLPAGSVIGGMIEESMIDKVAAELKGYLRSEKITTKSAVVSVNAVGNVQVNRTTIDWRDPRDIKAHLENEVKVNPQLLRATAEDYSIDLAVLGTETSNEGQRKLDVLLCGVKQAPLRMAARVLGAAGLRMVGADLNAFAVLRTLQLPPRGMGQLDVLIDLGADVVTMLVHENGKPLMVSLLTGIAGNAVDSALMAEMQNDDPTSITKNKVTANRDPLARQGMENYLYRLDRTVQGTITECLEANKNASGIAEITLVGGTALTPGLQEHLGKSLGLPVNLGEMTASLEAKQYETGTTFSHDYSASVGLAMGARI